MPTRARISANLAARLLQEAVREGEGVRIVTLAESSVRQPSQIINLGDFCNECGNCATFCPTAGAPYRDKPRLHLTRVSFASAASGYYLPEPGVMEGRHDGLTQQLRRQGALFIYEDENMRVELKADGLRAESVTLKNGLCRAALTPAVEMALMYRLLADSASYLRTLC